MSDNTERNLAVTVTADSGRMNRQTTTCEKPRTNIVRFYLFSTLSVNSPPFIIFTVIIIIMMCFFLSDVVLHDTLTVTYLLLPHKLAA